MNRLIKSYIDSTEEQMFGAIATLSDLGLTDRGYELVMRKIKLAAERLELLRGINWEKEYGSDPVPLALRIIDHINRIQRTMSIQVRNDVEYEFKVLYW